MRILTYLVNVLNNLHNILADNHCLLKNYYQIDIKLNYDYRIKYWLMNFFYYFFLCSLLKMLSKITFILRRGGGHNYHNRLFFLYAFITFGRFHNSFLSQRFVTILRWQLQKSNKMPRNALESNKIFFLTRKI